MKNILLNQQPNLLMYSYSSLWGLAEPQRAFNIFLTQIYFLFFLLPDLFPTLTFKIQPLTQTKSPSKRMSLLFGGKWWIRTTEGGADGFTVRCIWPLCKLPIYKK